MKNTKSRKRVIFERTAVILIAAAATSLAVRAVDDKMNGAVGDENSPCPPEMVFISSPNGGFCLDKYEVSAGEKCPYADPASSYESMVNLDNQACRPESKAGKAPWRNISKDQAGLACAKAGKRLPAPDEWLAGALGTPDTGGRGASDCHLSGNWESQPGLAGSGKNCVSAAGAFDMIGNVWEWVDGVASEGLYEGAKMPEAGYVGGLGEKGMPGITGAAPMAEYKNDYFWIKKSGLRGIARGGYWNNDEEGGQYAVYAVTPPSAGETGIGFRCAY